MINNHRSATAPRWAGAGSQSEQGGYQNRLVRAACIAGAICLLSALCTPAAAQLDGSPDTSFDSSTGPDFTVSAIAVQPNGKVLIGGIFTSYNGANLNHIARLNADGGIDTTFNTGSGASSNVDAIAIQPDGKILIGGSFTSYNGVAIRRIARLNTDGSVDTTFNPGTSANGGIRSIVLQPDGKILISGLFTSFNGANVKYFARLNANGGLDSTFNTGAGANDFVDSLELQPDSKVLIGGRFTSYDGTNINRVARLHPDGSIDTSFNPGAGADDKVASLAVLPNGKILIGGEFTSYGGTNAERVARLNADGSIDTTFAADPITNGSVSSDVSSIVVQADGMVLIAGNFLAVNGAARDRIARLHPDGSLDTTFRPNFGGTTFLVKAITLQANGKVLIGGYFTSVDGVVLNHVARLNNPSLSQAVSPAPVIITQNLARAEVGVLYTYVIMATGTPAPTFSVSGLPSWLTFDNVDTISGTPSAGDAGTSSTIQLTATNTSGTDSHEYQLEVVMAPVITSTAPTTAAVGVLYTYTITADGYPTPVFSALGGFPGWLSFSGDTLSGTPGPSDVGPTGILTLRASNGIGSGTLDQFNIMVTNAPLITSTAVDTATAGTPYTYTVTAVGAPAPTLAATTKPNWLSFDPGTGELTGTPLAGDIGTAGNDVVITATNANGTATQSFTIDVSGVAPQFAGAPAQFATVGVPYSQTISAGGIPAPTLTGVTIPAWLNFDQSTGVLSGTPGASNLGTTGNNVEIEAGNGWGTDTLAFTIQVNGVTPAIVSSAPGTAVAGQPYTYNLQATGNPSPSFSVAGLPAWLTFDNVNTISGTPQQADIGMTGTITVTATNGQAPDDTQSFQIDVLGNPPQITSTAPTSATEGALYQYAVTATGIPAPTFFATGLPAWLTLDALTGVLSGTPPAGSVAAGPITIAASNGWGSDDTQTFTIMVEKSIKGGGGGSGGGGCTASPGTPMLPIALIALAVLHRRRKRNSTQDSPPVV